LASLTPMRTMTSAPEAMISDSSFFPTNPRSMRATVPLPRCGRMDRAPNGPQLAYNTLWHNKKHQEYSPLTLL